MQFTALAVVWCRIVSIWLTVLSFSTVLRDCPSQYVLHSLVSTSGSRVTGYRLFWFLFLCACGTTTPWRFSAFVKFGILCSSLRVQIDKLDVKLHSFNLLCC
ncbi:hypothetical protein BDP27DRAFT_1005450 [Rhodocollybia butyracea]|uniref:Uncharacterized protein n=1 Tax=Rhodocollybia butyracea TaxID=206335 RepID=A0A9P5PMA7_9AGAR|nr:hypothetical protein BDP27DRAFT_1005416 [Rhodocollybia butyracea]KAF9066509.1 hypothetical protein BDP27DRAFT_1005450 [Rhodocollybia butyracea]